MSNIRYYKKSDSGDRFIKCGFLSFSGNDSVKTLFNRRNGYNQITMVVKKMISGHDEKKFISAPDSLSADMLLNMRTKSMIYFMVISVNVYDSYISDNNIKLICWEMYNNAKISQKVNENKK